MYGDVLNSISALIAAHPVARNEYPETYGIAKDGHHNLPMIAYISSSGSKDFKIAPTGTSLRNVLEDCAYKEPFSGKVEVSHRPDPMLHDVTSGSKNKLHASVATYFDGGIETAAVAFKKIRISNQVKYSFQLKTEELESSVSCVGTRIIKLLQNHGHGNHFLFGIVTSVTTGRMEILSMKEEAHGAFVAVNDEGLSFEHKKFVAKKTDTGKNNTCVLGVGMQCFFVEKDRDSPAWYLSNAFKVDNWNDTTYQEALSYCRTNKMARFFHGAKKNLYFCKLVEGPRSENMRDYQERDQHSRSSSIVSSTGRTYTTAPTLSFEPQTPSWETSTLPNEGLLEAAPAESSSGLPIPAEFGPPLPLMVGPSYSEVAGINLPPAPATVLPLSAEWNPSPRVGAAGAAVTPETLPHGGNGTRFAHSHGSDFSLASRPDDEGWTTVTRKKGRASHP